MPWAEQIRIRGILPPGRLIWYSKYVSEEKGTIPRGKMGPRERHLRSSLSKLAFEAGFLRGSLSVRKRVCGKPTCKCTRGDKHVSLYLVLSDEGKNRQVFIPTAQESQVRSWVENHKRARKLLEEVARICLDKVQKDRKRSALRARGTV
jgi:hypothetical protein